jgi:hypothetical protein
VNSPRFDFSKPHPRTVLWFKQRVQCETCAANIDWRCHLTRVQINNRPRWAYCIDAREPGQPCGPDALMHSPKIPV